VSNKILICRCEDVTLNELVEAVEKGHDDLESVKRFTGFGTGWKWVQQNSFLLYEDRRVVHPSAAHSRPRPYVLRGRPPDSLDRDWLLIGRHLATISRVDQSDVGLSRRVNR